MGNAATVNTPNPEVISELASSVIGRASGRNATCAINANQVAKCWGINADNILGSGRTSTIDRTPLAVAP